VGVDERDGPPGGSLDWDWGSQLPEDRAQVARSRLPAGSRLGPYTVVDLLGQGAMGAVYRASAPGGRQVAVKVIAARLSEEARQRLRREGQLTAALRHPGVVRVHEAGEADGLPFLAYELIEGARTLDQAWEGANRRQRVAWLRDAARALGHAHAQGVVHRDVKPGNVLVDSSGRLRVTDFGLALGADVHRLTQTGALVGTPVYMAPECVTGEASREQPTADVWSLGVILYQALTDRLPFPGETMVELAAQIVGGDLESPRAHVPDLPRELERVVLRALAQEPEDRYADGEALAAALDGWLEPAQASRSPAVLAAGALVTAVALGVAAAAATSASRLVAPSPASVSPAAPVTSVSPESARGDLAVAASDLSQEFVELRRNEGRNDDCSVAFLGRDRLIVRNGAEVGLLDLRARRLAGRWGGMSALRLLATLPDESGCLVASSRRIWQVQWDQAAPLLWEERASGRNEALAVARDAGGRWLLATGGTEAVRVRALRAGWPLQHGETVFERALVTEESVTAVGFDPAAREVWTCVHAPNELWRHRLADGVAREAMFLGGRPAFGAWSPASESIAVGMLGGGLLRIAPAGVRALDDDTTNSLGVARAHVGSIRGLCYAPDGRRLYSLGRQEATSTLKVWRLEPSVELIGRRELGKAADHLALSPDGAHVAVAFDDGTFEVSRAEALLSR
jgi:serine/threonine-protein kinase